MLSFFIIRVFLSLLLNHSWEDWICLIKDWIGRKRRQCFHCLSFVCLAHKTVVHLKILEAGRQTVNSCVSTWLPVFYYWAALFSSVFLALLFCSRTVLFTLFSQSAHTQFSDYRRWQIWEWGLQRQSGQVKYRLVAAAKYGYIIDQAWSWIVLYFE